LLIIPVVIFWKEHFICATKYSPAITGVRMAKGGISKTKTGQMAGSEIWNNHPLGTICSAGYY
jgi:hypothetical protein